MWKSRRGTSLSFFVLKVLIVAGVFALYAPSVQHMLFYDDPHNIVENLLDKSLLGVFIPGAWEYRPMGLLAWNLIRDLFGWYTFSAIHLFNVATHVLNTALVMMLADMLAGACRWRTRLFSPLAGLIFGFFPISFQTVIWASAVFHLLKASFGLGAIGMFIVARQAAGRKKALAYALTFLCLVAAFLSHESGVVFGPLLVVVELLDAVRRRVRPSVARIALGIMPLVYALLYRSFFRTYWSSLATSTANLLPTTLNDLPAKVAYFLQALDYWLAVLVRPLIGLQAPSTLNPWLLLMAAAVPILACAFLGSQRRLSIGLLALSIWLLDATLLMASLDANYIMGSPRMTYTGAIGIALFWAATIAAFAPKVNSTVKHPAFRITPRAVVTGIALAICALITFWSYGYVNQHVSELRRLTPGMLQLDADVHRLPASARVLLINPPAWSAPIYPALLFGAEGDVIYLSDASRWIGAISGHFREATALRHDISFVSNPSHEYGLAGTSVDDTGLRTELFKANLVYRFDFDPPGLRLSKLAELHPTPVTNSLPLARFVKGDTRIRLLAAKASVNGLVMQLDLTWASDVGARSSAGIFVHVVDAAGNQILTADRDFISGYLPPELVPDGTEFQEIRRVPLTPELLQAAQTARVKIGFYDRVSGDRYLAEHADGTPWDEHAAVFNVTP